MHSFYKVKAIAPNDIELENVEPDDDLIALSGGGMVTHWKLPKNILRCPVKWCARVRFETRSDLLIHYKTVHARHYILCLICDKPVGQLKHHYQSI